MTLARLALAIGLAIVPVRAGAQSSSAALTPRQAFDLPKSTTGRAVRISDLACVDLPGSGLVCQTTVGDRLLRIDAILLGSGTPSSVSQLLLSTCRGTANLTRPECRFDVVITPTTIYDETAQVSARRLLTRIIVAPELNVKRRGS